MRNFKKNSLTLLLSLVFLSGCYDFVGIDGLDTDTDTSSTTTEMTSENSDTTSEPSSTSEVLTTGADESSTTDGSTTIGTTTVADTSGSESSSSSGGEEITPWSYYNLFSTNDSWFFENLEWIGNDASLWWLPSTKTLTPMGQVSPDAEVIQTRSGAILPPSQITSGMGEQGVRAFDIYANIKLNNPSFQTFTLWGHHSGQIGAADENAFGIQLQGSEDNQTSCFKLVRRTKGEFLNVTDCVQVFLSHNGIPGVTPSQGTFRFRLQVYEDDLGVLVARAKLWFVDPAIVPEWDGTELPILGRNDIETETDEPFWDGDGSSSPINAIINETIVPVDTTGGFGLELRSVSGIVPNPYLLVSKMKAVEYITE
ncbi:MAG: hypothetical protein CL678_07870 [Bdellovibrionaceae bacterium]|nr:hypothetical protein [Pseudobdellovibrionaceae bacterium]|tara:strand:- start:732 stop:1838 length:1107 start_codon:yes stop_codon:yes gene_type:complete